MFQSAVAGGTNVSPASYTSWTDTKIIVVMPATIPATNGYVCVVNKVANGTTYSSSSTATTADSTLPQDLTKKPTVTAVAPNSAQAAVTTITITGTTFGASQTVTLSGISALSSVQFINGSTTSTQYTVISWSDTSVTCLAPSDVAAGTVTVKINTAQGGPCDANMTITMTAAPTPTPSSSVNPSGYTWKTATTARHGEYRYRNVVKTLYKRNSSVCKVRSPWER